MSNDGDKKTAPEEAPSEPASQKEDSQLIGDVLCALGGCSPPNGAAEACPTEQKKGKKSKGCPKQHQLPMFLSKTYHMIDRCDAEVATWSEDGTNFVVKNVEQFSSQVLPQYFKHSNFSSFARQLNFYGFRKLKAEPILTADYDARTACYVRFYHEKFQKDRPELLKDIKRATKSDMTSRDDLESLKQDICQLKDHVGRITTDYDRKLAEMSYEYNRRITALHAEYDRLGMFVQQLLAKHGETFVMPPPASAAFPPHAGLGPDMMQSLTQAASSLQNGTIAAAAAASAAVSNATTANPPAAAAGEKRPATAPAPAAAPPQTRARTG